MGQWDLLVLHNPVSITQITQSMKVGGIWIQLTWPGWQQPWTSCCQTEVPAGRSPSAVYQPDRTGKKTLHEIRRMEVQEHYAGLQRSHSNLSEVGSSFFFFKKNWCWNRLLNWLWNLEWHRYVTSPTHLCNTYMSLLRRLVNQCYICSHYCPVEITCCTDLKNKVLH